MLYRLCEKYRNDSNQSTILPKGAVAYGKNEKQAMCFCECSSGFGLYIIPEPAVIFF